MPWFIIPAAAISFITFKWTEAYTERLPDVQPLSTAAALTLSVILTCVLVLVAFVFTDCTYLRQGHLLLPGDTDPAPSAFRIAHSLVSLAYAGPVEEGALRNLVQLRLQRKMKPLFVEGVTGGVFVLLHVSRWATPAELPLVILLAIASGRLAAVTPKRALLGAGTLID